jgi:tellurite methyltransferase
MELLKEIDGLDLYVLDLLMKGYISKDARILDAGCGRGRNLHYFLRNGYSISGFDPNEEVIETLQHLYPSKTTSFKVSSIETFVSETSYDFIICNAVHHFAASHAVFFEQVGKLVALLDHQGVLFIRMTSNIGLEAKINIQECGRAKLPDESERYLLTHEILRRLLDQFKLELGEPLKTVNVSNLRCMSNLVLQRKNSSRV